MNVDTFVVQISFSIWTVIQFTKLLSHSKIYLQHDRKPLRIKEAILKEYWHFLCHFQLQHLIQVCRFTEIKLINDSNMI